jgi:hypothetical protein
MQNLLHVAIGTGLLILAVRYRGVVAAVLAITVAYLAVGVQGWSGGVAWLAMNPATAVFHVVLVAIVGVLLVPALWADRT